jgi:shikimate dehydrogenase
VPSARKFAEVWGSPISHSLSPVLHRCAYEHLGLDWEYHTRDIDAARLGQEFNAIDSHCVGLSLTMPLKQEILHVVTEHDDIVDVLGVANTVVFRPEGPRLVNTDVRGVIGALTDAEVTPEEVWIVGAGATARAVGYALSVMGVSHIALLVRSPDRAQETAQKLRSFGPAVDVVPFHEVGALGLPDLVVSTLPQVETFPVLPRPEVLHRSALFDVSYHPWPSAAAQLWAQSPSPVISGLSMLVHQAVMQIRWFYWGDGERALPEEDTMVSLMKRAVGLGEV